LWRYKLNEVCDNQPLKKLKKMQRRVALWIIGVFHTLSL